MCGPLAMAMPNRKVKKEWAILLYFTGKTLTYSLLGMLFGLFGSALKLAGFQQGLSIILGILLLFCAAVFLFKNVWWHHSFLQKNIAQWLSPLFGRVLVAQGKMVPFFFGMLNGLLPCGLVYLGLIGAIANGTAAGGFLFMAAFGLGTMPLLLSFLLMAKQLGAGFNQLVHKLSPYIMLMVAGLLIVRGLGLSIPFLSPAIAHALDIENGQAIGCHP